MRVRCAAVAVSVVLLVMTLGIPAQAVPESECVRTKRGFACTYGPLTLGPGENEFGGTVAAPRPSGYITYARARLVERDGDPVPGHAVHLHHSSWANPDESGTYCVPRYALVYITGKERTRMDYPDGYGYYWEGRTDSFIWDAMLDNMHDMTMTVYVRLNLHFERAEEGTLQGVTNNWLPATGCTDSNEFDVTKGEGEDGKTRRSATFEMRESGRFVWGTGHMHDGGLRMIFRNVTRGERIFASRALYDDPRQDWYLIGTTNFSSAHGIHADEGDILEVTAVYDSTHSWRNVMGNLRASYVPED